MLDCTRFLPPPTSNHKKVTRAAADEFLAAMAEIKDNLNATLWERICARFRKALGKVFGKDFGLTDADIRIALSRIR